MLQAKSSSRGAIEEFMVFSKPSDDDKTKGDSSTAKRASSTEEKVMARIRSQRSKKRSDNSIKVVESGVTIEYRPVPSYPKVDNSSLEKQQEQNAQSLQRRRLSITKPEETSKIHMKNNSFDECDLAILASKLEKIKTEKDASYVNSGFEPKSKNNNHDNGVSQPHNVSVYAASQIPQEAVDDFTHTGHNTYNSNNFQSHTLGRRHLSSSALRKSAAFQRRTKSVEAVDGYRINTRILNSTIHEEEPDRYLANHKAMSVESVDRHVHSGLPRSVGLIDENTRLASRSIPAICNRGINSKNTDTAGQVTPWSNSRSLANIDDRDGTNLYYKSNIDDINLYNSRSHGSIPEPNNYCLDSNIRINSRSYNNIADQKLLKARLFQSLDEYSQFKSKNLANFQDEGRYETNIQFNKRPVTNTLSSTSKSLGHPLQTNQFTPYYHKSGSNVFSTQYNNPPESTYLTGDDIVNVSDGTHSYYYQSEIPYEVSKSFHNYSSPNRSIHFAPTKLPDKNEFMFEHDKYLMANFVGSQYSQVPAQSSNPHYAYTSCLQSTQQPTSNQLGFGTSPFQSINKQPFTSHLSHTESLLRPNLHQPSILRKHSSSLDRFTTDGNRIHDNHHPGMGSMMEYAAGAASNNLTVDSPRISSFELGQLASVNINRRDHIDSNIIRQMDTNRLSHSEFGIGSSHDTDRMGFMETNPHEKDRIWPMDSDFMTHLSADRMSSSKSRLGSVDTNSASGKHFSGVEHIDGKLELNKLDQYSEGRMSVVDSNRMNPLLHGTVGGVDRLQYSDSLRIGQIGPRRQAPEQPEKLSFSHDNRLAMPDSSGVRMRSLLSNRDIIGSVKLNAQRIEPFDEYGGNNITSINSSLGRLGSTDSGNSRSVSSNLQRTETVELSGHRVPSMDHVGFRSSTAELDKSSVNIPIVSGNRVSSTNEPLRGNSMSMEWNKSQVSHPVSILVRKDDGHMGGATSELCHDAASLWANTINNSTTTSTAAMDETQSRNNRSSSASSKTPRKVTLVL